MVYGSRCMGYGFERRAEGEGFTWMGGRTHVVDTVHPSPCATDAGFRLAECSVQTADDARTQQPPPLCAVGFLDGLPSPCGPFRIQRCSACAEPIQGVALLGASTEP